MFSNIAVVAAMEREISFLRYAMTPPDRSKDRCVVGTICSKNVTLLRTGVGPFKTARRLAELAGAPPRCVLSIGCAGALDSNVGIADVVISEKLMDDSSEKHIYYPSPVLIEAAADCCKKLQLAFHLGSTISTSNVAATFEAKKDLAMKYGAIAVDMESAQVAVWAEANGIPMLSVRTISDGLTDRIPPEITAIVGHGGKLRLSRTFTVLVSQPRLLVEILRLKSKFDRSLETLEKVVMMLLQTEGSFGK